MQNLDNIRKAVESAQYAFGWGRIKTATAIGISNYTFQKLMRGCNYFSVKTLKKLEAFEYWNEHRNTTELETARYNFIARHTLA